MEGAGGQRDTVGVHILAHLSDDSGRSASSPADLHRHHRHIEARLRQLRREKERENEKEGEIGSVSLHLLVRMLS